MSFKSHLKVIQKCSIFNNLDETDHDDFFMVENNAESKGKTEFNDVSEDMMKDESKNFFIMFDNEKF